METQTTQTINFTDFLKVEMRVGTVVEAQLNGKAIKPAYALKIDFGDFGIKHSSAQITENYTTENLLGQKVIAVMNFAPKRVAGIKSEVLVLAVVCQTRGTVLLQPTEAVDNGTRIL